MSQAYIAILKGYQAYAEDVGKHDIAKEIAEEITELENAPEVSEDDYFVVTESLADELTDDDIEVIKTINDVYNEKGEIESDEAVKDIEDRLDKQGISVDTDYLGDMIVKSKEMITALNECTQVGNIGSYKRDSIDLIENEDSFEDWWVKRREQSKDFNPYPDKKKFTLLWDDYPGDTEIEAYADSLDEILDNPWAFSSYELRCPSDAILMAVYEGDDLVWEDGEEITEGVSFKDVYICKGCGKPLSQCTCEIEGLKENITYKVGYDVGDNFSKVVKVQADTLWDAMEKFREENPDKEITSIFEESVKLKESKTKSIESDVYDRLKDAKTKIGQKAFNVLDQQDIAGIISDGDNFWFEEYQQGNRCSKEVKNYLIRFIKKEFGLNYLYDNK